MKFLTRDFVSSSARRRIVLIITSKLANQRARKVLFMCVVYTF